MTVENLEINGNQNQTTENEANGQENHTEASALSEKEPKSLNLAVQKSRGYLGIRPVEPSHLKVASTYTSVGGTRPVGARVMDVKGTLTISGNRPIAASHLKVSQSYAIMGNRPVASNEIDDPSTLMGFID